MDVIDLYQIHWPNPEEEIEEGWETLARFKEQGKVRYIGVSNFNVEQMKRAQKIAPITSLQPPYSLLRRDIETEILPFCQEHNIGVINYSPMVSGLLTGKMTAERIAEMPADDWRKRSPNFNEPQAVAESEAGGSAAGNRQGARCGAGRGGDCLDAAASCDYGGDRGRSASRPGGWRTTGGDISPERRGN